jgi:malonyl-CoA decarboxylase
LSKHPNLEPLESDFNHLLGSWFNRGFLVLQPINWSTPANILEKIIRYEAVHEISDWDDLRRRIAPADRRCYAFFHPALNDEPLIFVEVAFTADMPSNIESILSPDRSIQTASEARTAVFYSISNCQRGLRGVTFGNFIIKQVVEDLAKELPNLQQFVTLSPMPGFMRWLKQRAAELPSGRESRLLRLSQQTWQEDEALSELVRQELLPTAAHFLTEARDARGAPLDPVARFHLGNGARLEEINWLANCSAKAMAQSLGLMVNYRYSLRHIERNHEALANQGEIACSAGIKGLADQYPMVQPL